MQYSKVKIFSIVALAIRLLLLEANGAPSNGLARARDLFVHSITERASPPPTKGPGSGSKDPPSSTPREPGTIGGSTGLQDTAGPSNRVFVIKPELKGYEIEQLPRGENKDGWLMHIVTKERHYVNELGVRARDNSMGVFFADNADDIAPNKMKLRGIILGVWKSQSGKNVEDLRRIYYDDIRRADTKSAIDNAFEVMQVDSEQQFLLSINVAGTRTGEQEAFQQLLTKTAFGSGAQKMTEEYIEMANLRVVNFIINRPFDKVKNHNMVIEFGVKV